MKDINYSGNVTKTMTDRLDHVEIIDAVILDLDFTIIGFKDGFQKLLDDLAGLSIDHEVLGRALNYSNENGFTVELFIKSIEIFQNKMFSRRIKSNIINTFNFWLENSLYVFDDARVCLNNWKDKIPLIILTFGDPAYQKRKLRMLGLDEFPIYYSSRSVSKARILGDLLKEYGKVFYVDDNINEINNIATVNTNEMISLFWLNRNSYPEESIKELPDYIEISSLLNVNKYLFDRK